MMESWLGIAWVEFALYAFKFLAILYAHIILLLGASIVIRGLWRVIVGKSQKIGVNWGKE